MKLRGVSILLCVLLITLPISFAKELSITRLSGLSGVDGYYTFNDGVNLTVRAALETEPNGVQADQLIMYIDGTRNERFDSCEQISGPLYECRFDRLFGPSPGEHLYEVRLYGDDDKFDEEAAPELTKARTFVLDMIPPEITEFSVAPPVSSDGRITLSWSAIDAAFDQGDTSVCAGIQKTEFYLETNPTTPFVTVPGQGECEEDKTYQHQLLGVPDGAKAITAKVYDKLGQFQVSEPVSISLDTGGPSVNSSGIRIYDTQGEVRWLRSNDQRLVTIEIPIVDDNPGSVRADFTQLTSVAGNNDKPATRVEDNYAIWENVRIRDFKQCKITVRAQDMFNHITTKTVDCDVVLDNTAPVLETLQTDRPSDSESYLFGVDTTIFARIRDSGSGVSADTVLLDAREVTGETAIPAHECEELSSGIWECKWLLTATRREGLREIALARTSSDRAGNRFTDIVPTGVEVFLDAPEFGAHNIRILPGQESGAPVLIKDSSFELTVEVQGHLMDDVYVDLENIGGELAPMQCNTKTCSIITQALASGPRETNITVIARNRAGNPAYLPLNITIYGLLEGEPNYWSPDVKCSPSRIDRQTASIIDPQIFCDLNLQNPNTEVQPIEVQFSGIIGCEEQAGNYVADMSLLNTQNSRHPTMAIRLFDNDYPMEYIQFSCPVQIYSTVRDEEGPKVHPLPEEENVTYVIGFHNQALGDLYKNLDLQVNQAVEEAQDYMEWVGKLNKFFTMAAKFCDLKQVIANILSAIDVITGVSQVFYDHTPPGTPPEGTARAVATKMCGVTKSTDKIFAQEGRKSSVWQFLDNMCTFVNCRATESTTGAGSKYLKPIGGAGGIGDSCSNIQSFMNNLGGFGGMNLTTQNLQDRVTRADAQFPQNFDVKNSLILSTMCLCVPGIIHNLNKLREIKCQKALCMKREVRNNGLPPSVCNDLEGYLECNFIVGDIFNLFPIARFWTQVTDMLANLLSDPTQLIVGYLGNLCRGFCDLKFGSQRYRECRWPKTFAKLGDAIASIKGIATVKERFDMTPEGGSCDQLEELQ